MKLNETSSAGGAIAPINITVIESKRPNRVGKKYFHDKDGKLDKRSIASIVEGEARTVDVSTADALVNIINQVGESDNLVLCPAVFNGAPDSGSFTVLSTAELVKRTGIAEDKIPRKVFDHQGNLYAARKKLAVKESAWILFDADNVEGMPEQWKALDIEARLQMWEPILPGISKCERVEVKSSSARVINGTGIDPTKHRHSHAWIRITNPERLEVLYAHLSVAIVNKDLFFNSPRRNKEGHEVIGHSARSIFDLATFVSGRLIFNAKPDVSRLKESQYVVSGVDAKVVKRGGGAFDNSRIEVPNDTDLRIYRDKTNVQLSMSSDQNGTTVVINNNTELTYDTEIEVKGVVKSLREWLPDLKDGRRIRCEAPFRDSSSQAAYIQLEKNGDIRVFDVGTRTNYWLKAGEEFGYEYDAELNNEQLSEAQKAARREAQRLESERIGTGSPIQTIPVASKLELSEMLEKFVFIGGGSCVYMLDNPNQNWNKQDFQNFFSASKTSFPATSQSGDPIFRYKPTTTLWFDSPERKTFERVTFKAGDGIVTEDPKTFETAFNLWRPRAPFEVPEDWEEQIKPFLTHIKWLWGEQTEKFLDWLAHIEQHPDELPHSGWLHIAKNQGMGRNWIAAVLARVFKGYCAPSFDLMDALQSGFNEQLSGRVLAIVDEIQETSGTGWKYANKLKQMMTEKFRTINGKHQRQYKEWNSVRFLLFSNHGNALPIDDTDRRWWVVSCDEKPKSVQYYKDLYKLVDNASFVASVVHFLKTRDVTQFNYGEKPEETAAKRNLIKQAKSEEEKTFDSLVQKWPVDVIYMSEIINVLANDFDSYGQVKYTRHMGHQLDKAGIVRVGPKKIRVKGSGRLEVAYAVRNRDKWTSLEDIRDEHSRLTGEEKLSALYPDNFEAGDGGSW